MRGLLVVISGPSGAGKGTICKELCKLSPNARLSISATTRPPRAGEVEGKDYYFKSEKEFQEMLTRGEMLEWARVYSYCYGTPRAPVAALMASGHDVILEIDVQGGLQVKQKWPDAVLVFIAPPSFEELERRLRGRGTETPEAIAQRMQWARSEMKQVKQYDYAVVNDNLAEAVSKVLSIIVAEKCRVKYYEFVQPF
ncbi:MAG: guanylate kinase [Bacillota bacterium]